jgi:ABC-type glutathione transport system ATPase component
MATETHNGNSVPMLRVRGLTKRYWTTPNLWRKATSLTALDNVSFEISAGKTLGLVGRSGSGKSTLARCVTRLEKPDDGEIWIGDANIAPLTSRDLLPHRSQFQMIFQDPTTAMNPRMSATEIIQEPLLIQRRGSRSEWHFRAVTLMREVGLSPDWMHRRVTEFSGGQRQRLAIARALTLEPKVLVLDEALTGLDLSTQAQMANLLIDLQTARSLTYFLISHDLSLVARVSDTIAVMSSGKVVEQGTTQQIMSAPAHPATQALLTSAKHFRAKRAAVGGPL